MIVLSAFIYFYHVEEFGYVEVFTDKFESMLKKTPYFIRRDQSKWQHLPYFVLQ